MSLSLCGKNSGDGERCPSMPAGPEGAGGEDSRSGSDVGKCGSASGPGSASRVLRSDSPSAVWEVTEAGLVLLLGGWWEKTLLWEWVKGSWGLISGHLGGGGLVQGPDKGSAGPGSLDSAGL